MVERVLYNRLQGDKESDGSGLETFVESGYSALYTQIPPARRQKGKQSVAGVGGISDAVGGFCWAAFQRRVQHATGARTHRFPLLSSPLSAGLCLPLVIRSFGTV